MNCENPECNHPQEYHMRGEFNCTKVIEKIYDKDNVKYMGIPGAANIAAHRLCPCEKFIYPKDFDKKNDS